ncbi:MAG: TrkH family potassium uptake protein [Aquamicrobium sp.]|uniref:TrkH family potassium uptake protein n=1 Tax=Aquamicrobium sp. TaxID=1872579 RepID=UPI00349EA28D|nr:TrkH family potassium uptake protein [Aquamicrobium sp.]
MQYSTVRAAVHIASVFAIYLSFAMLAPAAVDLYYGNDDWRVFAFCAFFTGGLALGGALATQGRPPPISSRFGFLVVNLLWLTTSAVGAVPLYAAASLDLTLAEAVFEAASGITTTGATIINGLDGLPPGILLWRSLLQWMGGLGVIAFSLFVLPFLNVGGISYFRIETSDITDRPFERLSTHITALIGIYSATTVLCTVLYAAAGMSGFDALNHALTTISTAGFSTHDASMGVYGDNFAILWIATVFMFLGALPFSIVMLLVVSGRLDTLRDPQIRVFAGYMLAFVAAVALYLRLTGDMEFGQALTYSAFNFVSLITTTGFATGDYTEWGPFVAGCALVATVLGGCSGSTSGGVKAYRFLILFKLLANGLKRFVYPNAVVTVHYGDRPVDDAMQRAVVLFISAFLSIWLILTLLLTATGIDILTALSGALTCLTNVGPGLGEMIGPAGNFSAVPDAAKWLLALAMLLGRLEILAVLVVFTPVFWRR